MDSMSAAVEESRLRARERALAKARRTRAANAYNAWKADPTPQRKAAWLRVWHDMPVEAVAS